MKLKRSGIISAIGVLFFMSVSTSQLVAQEINAKVIIDHSQIQGTNVSVFKTLESALNEFINNRTWTNQEFQSNERIDCNLLITLSSNDGSVYKGNVAVTARRPIYNASINTTLINLIDNDFQFSYNEFDPLVFNKNSLTQDLTAILGYYMYIILGLDADTFREFGGDAFYNEAIGIVNTAQSSGVLYEGGWDRLGSKKNRHVLISELLSSEFRPYRSYLYRYHRLGLDVMAESVEQGASVILDGLKDLEGVHANAPASYTMLLFFDVKNAEIQSIIREMDNEDEAVAQQKKELVDLLIKIDPSRLKMYGSLTE